MYDLLKTKEVTILILIDGFLQYLMRYSEKTDLKVTILILIDGFLQLMNILIVLSLPKSHNPYFNRWFSAIMLIEDSSNSLKVSQSLF